MALGLTMTAAGCSDDSSPGTGKQSAAEVLAAGLAAHEAGRIDEAQRLYEQLLQDDPTNRFALYNLGVIAQGRGDHDAAVERYDAALAVDPKFVSALYNRGVAYESLGRNENAEADFGAVLGLDPKHARAMYHLGSLLIARGDAERGIAMVAEATQLEPALRGDSGVGVLAESDGLEG
jgi:tetratricopeptide (TPR) repeat protein